MTRLAGAAGLALTLLVAPGCPVEEGIERTRIDAYPAPPVAGFRDVVNAVLPAIVFIQTEATPPPALQQILPGLPQLPEGPIPLGMGSGVIFSPDGYILTNNHVVHGAERVRVVLQDRRHFEAEVIGQDPSTDVAVVRIRGSGFATAELGDSDQIGLGDWVIALGSPLGLQFSVTAGVVSGVGRAIGILGAQFDPATDQAAPLEHFIQTDAALSPGNSGGPLVNSAGQVIGINTAIAAPPGSPGSVGFAIPSNLAHLVADQLIRLGEVRRPYLGVTLLNLTPAMAAAERLERVEGAVVAGIEPGGPAGRAGVLPGDIILQLAGEPVLTVSDLQSQLVRLEPGSTVPIRIVRAGQLADLTVELGMVRGGVRPAM